MTCLKCGETNTHAQMCQAGINLQIAHNLIGERDDWRVRAEKAEAALMKLADLVRAASAAGKVSAEAVTCAFCGALAPTDKAYREAVIVEHIKVCPKHPLAAALTRAEAAEKRAAALEPYARHFAECTACHFNPDAATMCTCGLSALLAPTVTP